MLQLLTGTGLAAAAGMNAYIPLLTVGLLARYTGLVTLPAGWEWLGNGWVLMVLAVLLAVELVADKIPALDSANDVLQTAVRPTSGGLVFGAGSSAKALTVTDPGALFDDRGWAPMTRRRRDPLDALSPREREVLALMAEGRINSAIARTLFVTGGAVEKHISSILAKLDLHPSEEGHRRVMAVLAWLRGHGDR